MLRILYMRYAIGHLIVYDHNGRVANVNNREKGQVQLEVEFL